MVELRKSWVTPLVVLLSVNIPMIIGLIYFNQLNPMGITAKGLIDLMILIFSDKSIKKMGIGIGKGLYVER